MNCSILIRKVLPMIFSFFFVSIQAQEFKDLRKDQVVHGFSAKSVYLNDAGQPMGGRFVHLRTGFTLDLLQIESVPQTFIYANTFPVSDMGEPHTQEHLLITKGAKGIGVNNREGMSVAGSNAFTQQLFTAYHFYTGAGTAVFQNLFEGYMDALLHPDYTNEEVRREVMNWGISEDPGKGLKIEEKGAVYNEMKTSMANTYSQLYDKAGRLVYGQAHPLSFNAGGLPDGIRKMGPDDIAKYHKENYHLWNMGAITSLPKTETLSKTLKTTGDILNRLEPNPGKALIKTLPEFQPAIQGQVEIVYYPSENDKEAGNYGFAFPANRELTTFDEILLSGFIQAFGGNPTSNLYRKIINSKTKELDLGAQSLYSYMDENKGQPVFFGIDEIASENLTKEKAIITRKLIMDELRTIANYADGSAELLAFNSRVKNIMTEAQRGLTKFINTPPKFGFRNTNSSWYFHLAELSKGTDFMKKVLLNDEYAEVDKILSSNQNNWKKYLTKWKILDVEPYVIISKASSQLITDTEAERKKRVEEELQRMKIKYAVNDDQAAIQKYKEEYDANSVALEKSRKDIKASFISNPPLSLDEELVFSESMIQNKVRLHTSTFNNMSSATVGLAIRLDETRPSQLVYLAAFPALITETGIVKNGRNVSFEEMSESLKKEILGLSSGISSNIFKSRTEYLLKGQGNNPGETIRAVEWMKDVLTSPNLTMENLPRIRDLVEQNLAGARKMMKGAEENWVQNPNLAYRAQNNPVYLSAVSSLTKAHHLLRLKWMIIDVAAANKEEVVKHFKNIAGIKASREDYNKLLMNLQSDSATFGSEMKLLQNITPSNRALMRIAANDVQQTIAEIPDESLSTDWNYLWNMMASGIEKGPDQTLKELNDFRKGLLKKDNLRMFVISSGSIKNSLMPGINKLVGEFSDQRSVAQQYPQKKYINDRISERSSDRERPVFVGLLNPNSTTGVFMNSVRIKTYESTDKEDQLRYLAAGLYGGGGPQSVFSKTTGAGLSYSTGVGASPSAGLINYYAERTPELPQTLSFVIDELKKSGPDQSMGEYVIANAFALIRSASDYESRGESMANDYVDGFKPEKVRAFRKGLLELRKMPNLVDELYKRKTMMYEQILPGYGGSVKNIQDAQYFVLGPEKQMVAYEAYLKKVEGQDTKLVRIYPRDYWITD